MRSAACLLLSCLCFVSASAAEKKPPHVVIILVDDMGYGDPGCYNADSKIPTPNIDSLAREGMRFTDAHASGPLCHMSRYGLMTGRYPFRVNVNLWPKQRLIQAGEVTIASLLRGAGYRTAMVGKWHLGFDEQGYDKPLRGGPVDCGFDSYFGIRASTDIPPYFYIRDRKAIPPPTDHIEANASEGWSPIQGAFWRAGGIAPGLDLADVLPKFTDEACEVIESHADRKEPLMMYVAFPAPHTPWLPSEAFVGKSQAGMYGDFAVMVDAMVGKILGQLKRAGMDDDTLVIFSSDNGPVWYDNDVERFGHDSSGGLRGMKADAWECGHRMPFLVRWPGMVNPNSTSDKLVSFVDLLATFDELVGGKKLEAAGDGSTQATGEGSARATGEGSAPGPDSFSFLGELTGDETEKPQRKSLALKSGRGLMTLRRGEWKWIDGEGSGGFSGGRGRSAKKITKATGQLYNLAEDLGETNNLVNEHADVVAELKTELAEIVEAGRSR